MYDYQPSAPWGKRPVMHPIVERDGVKYKTCSLCKVEQNIGQFGFQNPYMKRYNPACFTCRRKRDRLKREVKNPRK